MVIYHNPWARNLVLFPRHFFFRGRQRVLNTTFNWIFWILALHFGDPSRKNMYSLYMGAYENGEKNQLMAIPRGWESIKFRASHQAPAPLSWWTQEPVKPTSPFPKKASLDMPIFWIFPTFGPIFWLTLWKIGLDDLDRESRSENVRYTVAEEFQCQNYASRWWYSVSWPQGSVTLA